MPYEHRRFCTYGDVVGILTQRSFSNTPSLGNTGRQTAVSVFDVRDRIRDYAGYLEGFLSEAGYVLPVPTQYTYSSTVIPNTPLAFIACANSSIFQQNDSVIIRGIDQASGMLADESSEVINVSATGIYARSRYTYDTSTTIIRITGSLGVLRNLNATGAAAHIERGTFMGGSPNDSDVSRVLWLEWQGGVARIRDIPHWLVDLPVTGEAPLPLPGRIRSYGQTFPNDPDIQPRVTISQKF